MLQELFEQESTPESTELSEFTETSEIQKYFGAYEQARDQGNIATARYYLGKIQGTLGTEESDAVAEATVPRSLGAAEVETEKTEEERKYLEHKLSVAKDNLRHATKMLNKLLAPNSGATRNLIADREYQIKVYQKDIQSLERSLSRL